MRLSKLIKMSELQIGEYAITEDGKPVLCVSSNSFRPKYEDACQAVHIVNGIGAFPATDKCRIVSMQKAFEVAAKAVAK